MTSIADVSEGELNDSISIGVFDCNVARIEINSPIDIEIYSDEEDEYQETISSEEIVNKLEEINNDADYQAVLFVINSPGGDPVASEEIMNAVKKSGKPVIAVIKSIGASGAYMAASGADYIFASKFSDVGSIGVTWSYVDNSVKNQKEGLTYNELASGKFKDTHDPDKPLTKEEKDLLMRDILIIHELFVKIVAENRNLPVEKVGKLADGSTMMGDMALASGLIDAIGGEYEAKQWLKDKLQENINICDYE